MNEKRNTLILVVGGALLFVLGFIVFSDIVPTKTLNTVKSVEQLDAYAQEMVQKCKDAPYRPTCYEEEVPKLVTELESPQIFEVIRLIRNHDPEYLFCHVLAHELGTYEVSLDPDNWLDVVAMSPSDGLCSNGFAHGAIVTRFNDGELSPEELDYALKDLAIACETREGWNPTELIKSICYHGVGHVLIHMTEADVDTSLDACEEVALKDDGRDYTKLCTEGVYMQLFQPLEPEDYALIDLLPEPPTRENINNFCATNSNTSDQYGACWREAWPIFYKDLFDSKKVVDYCSQLTKEQGQDDCFVTAFTINGRHHLGDPDAMAGLCNAVPSQYQGMCFSRGANAFPEENQALIPEAIDMCSRANTKTAQNECYSFLARVASFNFHPGSDALEEMCTSLPSEWGQECRAD